MTAVEVFQFPATGEQVRTVVIDGEPWFVAADICAVLGYGGGARNAVARLPERMKGVAPVNTRGGAQQVAVLNEAGAYRLVMRSTLPGAEAFQDWLAEEVVPAIRKTGSYQSPHQLPQTFAEALELAAAQAREIEEAQAKVAELAPKAEAHEAFESADGTYSFEQVAKMIHAETGLGRNNLIKRLRVVSVLTDKNLPYQRYAHHFHVVASSFEHTDGRREISYTTRVRASGVDFIRRKLGAAQGVLVPVT